MCVLELFTKNETVMVGNPEPDTDVWVHTCIYMSMYMYAGIALESSMNQVSISWFLILKKVCLFDIFIVSTVNYSQ